VVAPVHPGEGGEEFHIFMTVPYYDRSNQATDHSDFELVTWLVIKGEK
jgi:hypothetical protein